MVVTKQECGGAQARLPADPALRLVVSGLDGDFIPSCSRLCAAPYRHPQLSGCGR